jgi:hypothetical protein
MSISTMSLQSLIDKPKELLELINDCLKPKDIEKKKYGEVFTPMNLVDEMLDGLPNKVWQNKNLKWFDPACGMGNFTIAVYLRLIDELKDKIKNENERKKHILENMLYISEINKKNILIFKQIFDINNEYKLNIYNGDTLKIDIKKEFGFDKFDIIIGNPPYNKDISKTNAGGQIIWNKFVEFCYKNLANKGFLVFIHPPNWRKPDHELRYIFFNNQILKLRIFNDLQAFKYFDCKIRVDYYILQKTDVTKNTLIIDETNNSEEILINNKLNFIPNFGIGLVYKVANNNLPKLNCMRIRTHDTSRKVSLLKHHLMNINLNF